MKDPRLKAPESEKKEENLTEKIEQKERLCIYISVFNFLKTFEKKRSNSKQKSMDDSSRNEIHECLDCLKMLTNCSKCRKNKRIFDEVFFANVPNISVFFDDDKSEYLNKTKKIYFYLLRRSKIKISTI